MWTDTQALESFFISRKSRGCRDDTTIRVYFERLHDWLVYAHQQGKQLIQLDRRDIERHIVDLTGRLSDVTVNGRIKTLRLFYNYITEEGIRSDNPMTAIHKIPEEEKPPKTLSDHQIRSLLTLFPRNSFEHARNRLIILTLLDTMVRCGELVQIKIEDVDLAGGTIYICHRTKTRRRRYVPMSFSLSKQLLSYRTKYGIRYHLFPKRNKHDPITVNAVRTMFYRAQRQLGFRVFAHALRHTGATKCIEAGMSPFVLQRILGHASIKTTQVYVNADRMMKSEHDRYSPVVNLGGG